MSSDAYVVKPRLLVLNESRESIDNPEIPLSERRILIPGTEDPIDQYGESNHNFHDIEEEFDNLPLEDEDKISSSEGNEIHDMPAVPLTAPPPYLPDREPMRD